MGNEPKADQRGRSMIDPIAARRGFDRAARRNQGRALLGEEIARRMAARLDLMRIEPRNILDAGCGAARASRLLGERYPGARFFCLDLSHEMLLAGTSRLSGWRRRLSLLRGSQRASEHAVCADMNGLPLVSGSMDVVWCNLALPWSNSCIEALREFRRVLREGGLLMFSTYGPDTLAELRASLELSGSRPRVHEFADMHDLGDSLVAAGFAAPVMDMEKLRLSHASVEALLRELRLSGEINVLRDRQRGLWGPRLYHSMLRAYPVNPGDGRVISSFEIIYGHAWIGRRKDAAHETAPIKFHGRAI